MQNANESAGTDSNHSDLGRQIEVGAHACPGCGRAPGLTLSTEVHRARLTLWCGPLRNGCTLQGHLTATGETVGQALEVWNRRALDEGDRIAEADTGLHAVPHPVQLPTGPRAGRAFRLLRSFSPLSAAEVARTVEYLERSTDWSNIVGLLWFAGVDASDARIVAAGLGYHDGPVDCWACRRVIGASERRTLGVDAGGPHWLCADHERTSTALEVCDA